MEGRLLTRFKIATQYQMERNGLGRHVKLVRLGLVRLKLMRPKLMRPKHYQIKGSYTTHHNSNIADLAYPLKLKRKT